MGKFKNFIKYKILYVNFDLQINFVDFIIMKNKKNKKKIHTILNKKKILNVSYHTDKHFFSLNLKFDKIVFN